MRTSESVGAWGRGSVGERTPALPPSRTPAPPPRSSALQVLQVVFTSVFLLGLTGCSYYSFSGATIPQEHETIAIMPIENATATPLRNLEGRLTDLLTERFVERTRLRLETNENEADVILTGRLTQYNDQPTAVSGDERATRNEITIRTEMRYTERDSTENLIDGTYTQSETYDVSAVNEDAETAAVVVLENIADEVFADATSNW